MERYLSHPCISLPPSRDARGILGNRLLKLVRPPAVRCVDIVLVCVLLCVYPAVRCVDSVLVCVLLCVYLSYVLSLLYSTVLLHWTEVFSTAY